MRNIDEPTKLIRRVKKIRNVWLGGLLFLLYLAFTGRMGGLAFFWIFFWTFLAFFAALYLALDQIRCPTCNVRLLSRKAIQSPDTCYNCGRDLNSKKDSKRDIANRLIEKYKDQGAARTSWKPIQMETANFDTHKLRMDKNGQPAFKSTIGNYLFAGFFLTIGLLFYTGIYFVTYNNIWMYLLITGLPLLFVLAGLYMIYLALTPIRLDRKNACFIFGWGRDDKVFLDEIKAVQLLSYRTTRYTNTQINLVLNDHSRKKIVTYYNRKKAFDAAQTIAAILGVSLWNSLDTND